MNYRVLKTYTQPNVGQIGVGSVSLVEYPDGSRRWVEHNAVNLHGQAMLAMGGTLNNLETLYADLWNAGESQTFLYLAATATSVDAGNLEPSIEAIQERLASDERLPPELNAKFLTLVQGMFATANEVGYDISPQELLTHVGSPLYQQDSAEAAAAFHTSLTGPARAYWDRMTPAVHAFTMQGEGAPDEVLLGGTSYSSKKVPTPLIIVGALAAAYFLLRS